MAKVKCDGCGIEHTHPLPDWHGIKHFGCENGHWCLVDEQPAYPQTCPHGIVIRGPADSCTTCVFKKQHGKPAKPLLTVQEAAELGQLEAAKARARQGKTDPMLRSDSRMLGVDFGSKPGVSVDPQELVGRFSLHGATVKGIGGLDTGMTEQEITVQLENMRNLGMGNFGYVRNQEKHLEAAKARAKDLAEGSTSTGGALLLSSAAGKRPSSTDMPALSGQEKPALCLIGCGAMADRGAYCKYHFDRNASPDEQRLADLAEEKEEYERAPHPAEPRWPVEALARAIFVDWLTEEAACIADQQSSIDHVLDVMWAKTKPAERLEAERMATRLVERMGPR